MGFTSHPTSRFRISVLNFDYFRQKVPFESSMTDLTLALLIGDYRTGEDGINLFSKEK